MDAKYSVGALVGIGIWELAKQVIAAFFKRTGESADAKRKMIREACDVVVDLVVEVQELAEHYYGQADKASEESKTTANSIRAKLKAIGIKFQLLNSALQAGGKPITPPALVFKFRSAVSLELDVLTGAVWQPNDPRYLAIHRQAIQLCAALNSVKLNNT